MTIIIPPLRPPSPPSPSLLHFLFLVFAATRVSHIGAINLDIHIPLPTGGCVVEEALRANWLLRDASPTGSFSSSSSSNSTRDDAAKAPPPALEQPSERIDLFARHTPHVTLFLSDFDLEDSTTIDDDHSNFPSLNRTKLQQFLNAISSLNITDISLSMDCSLSYATTTTTTTTPTSSSSKYYVVSGPYTMLPIQNDPCLRTLSDRVQRALRPFLRRPVVVPSWVASLPEPERSRAIYRCREFGSPNVGEGFVPHVSVGFDPTDDGDGNGDWRIDAMEEWSEGHRSIHGECTDLVGGVAVGMTGEGGTVLAGSRLGYWDLLSAVRMGKDDEGAYNGGHGLRAGDNDVSVVE